MAEFRRITGFRYFKRSTISFRKKLVTRDGLVLLFTNPQFYSVRTLSKASTELSKGINGEISDAIPRWVVNGDRQQGTARRRDLLLVQEAARSARSPGRAILVDLPPCARGAPTDLHVIHAEKKQLTDFAAMTTRLIRTKSGDHTRNTHARILRP
jgi:hypothetical protein